MSLIGRYHKCIVKHLKPNSLDRKVIEIATIKFQEESKHLYKLGKHDRIPCLYARFQENGDRQIDEGMAKELGKPQQVTTDDGKHKFELYIKDKNN